MTACVQATGAINHKAVVEDTSSEDKGLATLHVLATLS